MDNGTQVKRNANAGRRTLLQATGSGSKPQPAMTPLASHLEGSPGKADAGQTQTYVHGSRGIQAQRTLTD
jgi:hypothetical protein